MFPNILSPLRWFFSLALLWSLAGCAAAVPGLFSSLFGGKGFDVSGYRQEKDGGDVRVQLKSIDLSASIDANNDSAIVIHAVSLFSPRLINIFESMSAKNYFRDYQQLRMSYPGMFHVDEWQLTPGQAAIKQKIKPRERPKAIFLFADYMSPGVHRARVGEAKHIRLSLERDRFRIFYDER